MRKRGVFAALLVSIIASGAPARIAATTVVERSLATRSSHPRDTGDGRGLGTRTSGQDSPDALGGDQTHVVYFVPKDRDDESLDTATLPRSIDAIRAWFSREMAKTGPPQTPRFDRTSAGDWDVTFVRGDNTAVTYGSQPGTTALADVEAELKQKGFASGSKRYLIFAALDRGTTCGEGDYPLMPDQDTGHYAIVYLDSDRSCGARSFASSGTASGGGKAETIAAHEWLHNEGVAPPTAPHYCATSAYHICTGPLWMMPELDPEAPEIVFPLILGPLGDRQLDPGRDDYLDTPVPVVRNLRSSPWFE